MKYRHYLQQLLTLPPQVVWQKGRRKVRQRLQREIGRLQTRWFDTTLSDQAFFAALVPSLAMPEAFLKHIATRNQPRFYCDARQQTEVISIIRQHCPDAENLTITAAGQVCAHKFDLLGSGLVSLGDKIDWHCDFKSGHRWDQKQYYADVQSAPYPGGYDLKMPWELSRCQHFAWLGQAYWFTKNEKYAQEFVSQVQDWLIHNPPKLGVNWACAMDVAIRAVNWLWGYYFFQHSIELTDKFLISFFKSLLIHGRHIFNNLERTETLTSNHYLSDIVGLVYLGILLPEFKEAQRWREFGLSELEKEMFKQVYPDGVNFEASTNYHRLVTELFLLTTLIAEMNGHSFSTAYLQRLEKMLEFIATITKPDGTVPLIGDCDNGRLHRLKVWSEPEREWTDFRYLLAIGAVYFDRTEWAQIANDQWIEAFWIWGNQALKVKLAAELLQSENHLPASQHFSDAGLLVMRCYENYALINAGPNGQGDNGGHAHNDKLSFELFGNGQTWLVDPGTYLYTADHNARNLFRSTRYHNTVVIDGQEQNRFAADPSNLFQLHNDAKAKVLQWYTSNEFDLFVGEHQGYTRLPGFVNHRRTLVFDKINSVWILHDFISARRVPFCESCFHVAPGLGVDIVMDPLPGVRFYNSAGQQFFLFILSSTTIIPYIESGWISKGYGTRIEASVVVVPWPKQEQLFTVGLGVDIPGNPILNRSLKAFEHFKQLKVIS